MIGETVADEFFYVLSGFRRVQVTGGPPFEAVQEFEPVGEWRFFHRNPLNGASLAARSFKEQPVASMLLSIHVTLDAVFPRSVPANFRFCAHTESEGLEPPQEKEKLGLPAWYAVPAGGVLAVPKLAADVPGFCGSSLRPDSSRLLCRHWKLVIF